MVWRSVSLRYETGEKKVNEVDFISQGVELVSRISATMINWMVVKEIEDVLVEELEKLGWWFEQDIDGEDEDDNEKKLMMMNEERWMD
ncbi:hypothetical protein Tco_0975590 [Tanacetum coccineum]|uniref:Uncharacterized protein n=1 Tax=Tanacetum coccineum TaxID=301880 RepID=A0ABQ5EF33_9ASTR